MPEAEVTLRLAFWYLDTKAKPGTRAELAIDGAHVRIKAHRQGGRRVEERTVFPIEEFLAANGCEPRVTKNGWSGEFTRNGRAFNIKSTRGFDFRVQSGNGRVLAECKGGPLGKGQSESAIFARAIGQAITADSSPEDQVWIAVPDSPTFERVGRSITRKRAFQRTGIRIFLVAENGGVRLLPGARQRCAE